MVPTVSPLILTDKAAAHIKKLKASAEASDSSLRVSVTGGGCSGLSYKLSFDKEFKPEDTFLQQKDVSILIDRKSLLFITGTIIDFDDGLDGQGFIFNNPKAKSKCGCGTSFSA